MNFNKKSLISIFEIAFILLLFSFSIIYFNQVNYPLKKDYKNTIDSALNLIYYDDVNRNILMSENLSISTINQNFTNISNFLNLSFLNYELIISNKTKSKTIFNCTSNNEKYFSEKIISIKDNDNFEFRKIKLGVCY